MIHQEQHNAAAADIISSSQTQQDIRTKHHQLGSETSCQNISTIEKNHKRLLWLIYKNLHSYSKYNFFPIFDTMNGIVNQ